MDKELLDKLKEYNVKNHDKVMALRGWIDRYVKTFKLTDALACIYKYADGNMNIMNDIIAHLAMKKKTYGRTQVYSDYLNNKTDIVRNDNGELELIGYYQTDALPLKGQKISKNHNIFRKSDNQTSKIYHNTEERIMDIGAEVRGMYPNASKVYIEKTIQAIRNYAQIKKINYNRVIELMKKGRVRLDDERFVIRPIFAEGRTIIISYDTAKLITEELTMSEYKFYNNVKDFLRTLLSDPINADVSLTFKKYGITRSKLLRMLLNNGIVEVDEKINDTDEFGNPKTATMMVKYRVPKAKFEHKLKKLYIKLFEKNVPEQTITEDGATGSDASGQFVQPAFGIQRRTFANDIEEATTTSTVGDYQYDVPFVGDKETLARKNGVGGSISVNIK